MSNLIPIYKHHATTPYRFYYDKQALQKTSAWSEGEVAFYAYETKMSGTIPIYMHRALVSEVTDHYYYDKQVQPKSSYWGAGEVAFYAHGTEMPGAIPIYVHQASRPERYFYDSQIPNNSSWSPGEVAFYAYATSTDDISWWWCQCFSWEQKQQFAQRSNKRAAFQRGVLWDQGKVITYSIKQVAPQKEGDAERERIIDAAFAEWNQVGMSISFEKIEKWEDADIRIERDPGKADSSLMGTEALKPGKNLRTMNLGLRKGLGDIGHTTALHEIGHAIGLVHEHQRVDSEIVWNKEGVYDYFANRKPVPVTDQDQIDRAVFEEEKDFEPFPLHPDPKHQYRYDSKSVMNYDFPAKCFDGPDDLKRNGIVRSKNLTDTDKATAKAFYPKLRTETRSKDDEQKIDSFEVFVNNGNFNVSIKGTVGKGAYIALHDKDKKLKYDDYLVYYYLENFFESKSIESDDFPMMEVSGKNWINYNASSEMRIVLWDSRPSNHTIDAQYVCLIPRDIGGGIENRFLPAPPPGPPNPNEKYFQHVRSFRAFLNNSDWNVEVEGVFSPNAWIGLYQGVESPEYSNYTKYEYIKNFALTTRIDKGELVYFEGSYWFNTRAQSNCYFVIWDSLLPNDNKEGKRYIFYIPEVIKIEEKRNYD